MDDARMFVPWEEDMSEDISYNETFPISTNALYANDYSPLENELEAYSNGLPRYACSSNMTSSASCPSFTSLQYTTYPNSADVLLGGIDQEEWKSDSKCDIQFQEPYVAQNMQFPEQLQMTSKSSDSHWPLFNVSLSAAQVPLPFRAKKENACRTRGNRSNMRNSASFTCLASVEREYRKRNGSRRRNMMEPWCKRRRQTSFDSTATSSLTVMSRSTSADCLSNFYESSSEMQVHEECGSENDMIGISIDEFLASECLPNTYVNRQNCIPRPMMEGMLEQDEKRKNLEAALQDSLAEEQQKMEETSSSITSLLQSIELVDLQDDLSETSIQSELATLAGRDLDTHSFTAMENAMDRGDQRARCQVLGQHLRAIFDSTCKDVSAYVLEQHERIYLSQSKLFTFARCAVTAGSLWLLLHSSKCDIQCDISGCEVMKRVIRHCLSCTALLGKCKDTCDEARAILLHYGHCKTSQIACNVCSSLYSIDAAHQASRQARASTKALERASQEKTSIDTRISAHIHPIPIQPNFGRINTRAPSPPFICSFALYLEQTCAPFRAELNARIEKRVTASASQNLLQHMQTRTRLRSLEDLRAEARTAVLRELEGELCIYMQSISNTPLDPNMQHSLPSSPALPPYLTNLATASSTASFLASQRLSPDLKYSTS